MDALELQIAAALQRYHALQRRVEQQAGNPDSVAARALAELGSVLELLRAVQEQIAENRRRIDELHAELAAQLSRYSDLFDQLPEPCLVTRADTTIVDANRAAAELLNVSQRFLPGKALSVFICEERVRFLDESHRIAREKAAAEWRIKLRPRERAPLTVSVRVRGDGSGLRLIVQQPPSPAQPTM